MNLRVRSLSGGEICINPKNVIAYHYDGQILNFHYEQKTIAVQGEAALEAIDWFLKQEHDTIIEKTPELPQGDFKFMFHKNAPIELAIIGDKPDKNVIHCIRENDATRYATLEEFIKSGLREFNIAEGKFYAENVPNPEQGNESKQQDIQ